MHANKEIPLTYTNKHPHPTPPIYITHFESTHSSSRPIFPQSVSGTEVQLKSDASIKDSLKCMPEYTGAKNVELTSLTGHFLYCIFKAIKINSIKFLLHQSTFQCQDQKLVYTFN